MKKLILVVLSAFAINANASIKNQLSTKLVSMNFQQGTELAEGNFSASNINVNFFENKINLTLLKSTKCPPNAFCIMPTMMIPTIISADLKTATTNRCGVSFFTAKSDTRLHDGNLTKISVIDRSQNICPILTDGLFVPTSVTLTIETLRGTKEIHTFEGDFLR